MRRLSKRTTWRVGTVVIALGVLGVGALVVQAPDGRQLPDIVHLNAWAKSHRVAEPIRGLTNVRAVPFHRVEVDEDGRLLWVEFNGGVDPCRSIASVDVHQASTAVTVILREGQGAERRVGKYQRCGDADLERMVRVRLREPLGDRVVLDGSCRSQAGGRSLADERMCDGLEPYSHEAGPFNARATTGRSHLYPESRG